MGTSPSLLAITTPGLDLEPFLPVLGAVGWPSLLLRHTERSLEQLIQWADQALEVGVGEVWLHHADLGEQDNIEHPSIAGVHLGRHAYDAGVRPRGRFGVSAHSEEEVMSALEAGADYVLYSPLFPPISKPNDMRPYLGAVRFLKYARGRPVLALGGVQRGIAAALFSQGASGVAVSGALFGGSLQEFAIAAAQFIDVQKMKSSSS